MFCVLFQLGQKGWQGISDTAQKKTTEIKKERFSTTD